MIGYILCEIQMHSLVLLFYILFGYHQLTRTHKVLGAK